MNPIDSLLRERLPRGRLMSTTRGEWTVLFLLLVLVLGILVYLVAARAFSAQAGARSMPVGSGVLSDVTSTRIAPASRPDLHALLAAIRRSENTLSRNVHQPLYALVPIREPNNRTQTGSANVGTSGICRLLTAIQKVESGGAKNGGRDVVADRGRAIGPFCIWRSYWRDSRVPGRYEDCRSQTYAMAVVMAYWRRYAGAALAAVDAEVLARTHNGGPCGAEKVSTLGYWQKVKAELDKEENPHA